MQAVEVTKLSLMLKCLEGESNMSLDNEKSMFGERALPSMEENIKCGNSLIGSDFYNSSNEFDFGDSEAMLKINAFDWKSEFKDVFDNGGFDIVIGNPPYVFARNEMFTNEEKEYYYSNYFISEYQLNTYLMFIEKAYSIVKDTGLAGYIIPNNYLTINSFDKFRHFILDKTNYLHIINSFDKVFSGASVDTCILIFSKSQAYKHKHTMGELRNNIFTSVDGNFTELLTKNYIINTTQCLDPNNPIPTLMDKINDSSVALSNVSTVKTGLVAYETGKGKPSQTDKMKNSRIYHSDTKKDDTYWKYLQGVDVARYSLNWSGEWLSYGKWLAAPRVEKLYTSPRILVRQIPNKLPYCIHAICTDEHILNDRNSMIVFEFMANSLFVLGILNSKLTSFWFAHYFGKLNRGLFPQFKVNELAQFPIPNIDLNNPDDKQKHDDLVKLVDTMLELNKSIKNAANQSDENTIRRLVEATDRRIDGIVYSLYGLSEEEIKIIEG